MKIDKKYPFAVIYFFFNSVGLPFGLLYTILFTPVFYLWLITKHKKNIIFKFLIVALPFVINHLIHGVDLYNYVRSLILFFSVYIFCLTFLTWIREETRLKFFFKKLLNFNFFMVAIAIFFVFTPLKDVFWGVWSIETGNYIIDSLPRLKMLTYEPSYYSTLLVPIAAFYITAFILKQNEKDSFTIAIKVLLPLVLSFSMGVIGGLIVAVALLFLTNLTTLLTSKRILTSFLLVAGGFVLTFIFLLLLFPENPFFVRLHAIIAGGDGSANGRTFEAFHLAHVIAKEKSIWWGVGPGQLKIIGDPIIKEFYKYPPDYGQVSIPSAFPETIALFGYIGAAVRLFIEIYLYFKTKVYSNYYRSLLFFYIFIYQFTGSFTTNIAEYVIWILAFTNVFPEFDKKNYKPHSVPVSDPAGANLNLAS